MHPGAEPVDLVVVAPGLRDEAMSKYIDRLRSVFQIPISYGTFSLGDKLPGALNSREPRGDQNLHSTEASAWQHGRFGVADLMATGFAHHFTRRLPTNFPSGSSFSADLDQFGQSSGRGHVFAVKKHSFNMEFNRLVDQFHGFAVTPSGGNAAWKVGDVRTVASACFFN
jgi:hypothetical protein